MKHTKMKWRGIAPLSKGLLAAAIAVGSLLIPAGASHADSNSTIRVALYADIGSKYKSTVPVVTMLSTQSFTLMSNQPGALLCYRCLPRAEFVLVWMVIE